VVLVDGVVAEVHAGVPQVLTRVVVLHSGKPAQNYAVYYTSEKNLSFSSLTEILKGGFFYFLFLWTLLHTASSATP
jgi:hypothetical protein